MIWESSVNPIRNSKFNRPLPAKLVIPEVANLVYVETIRTTIIKVKIYYPPVTPYNYPL